MRGESETWENGIYIHPYDRFHITPRRSHWVQNNETAAILGYQKTSVEIDFFSHGKTFFIPRNLLSS